MSSRLDEFLSSNQTLNDVYNILPILDIGRRCGHLYCLKPYNNHLHTLYNVYVYKANLSIGHSLF